MTVAEAIEKLKEMPQGMECFVYDDTYDEFVLMKEIEVRDLQFSIINKDNSITHSTKKAVYLG